MAQIQQSEQNPHGGGCSPTLTTQCSHSKPPLVIVENREYAIKEDNMMKDAIKKMEKQCFSCGQESCKLISYETICGMKYYVKCTQCGAVGLDAFDPERAVYYWNNWGVKGYE